MNNDPAERLIMYAFCLTHYPPHSATAPSFCGLCGLSSKHKEIAN